MRSNRVHRRLAALGVVISLVAGACGAASSPAPSAGSGAATPPPSSGSTGPGPSSVASPSSGIPQGGTLSIGWNGEIQWLDPALGYDVTSWPAERLMFEPLLAYDEGTALKPLLADGMPTVSADGKAYTFKLHSGVNFVNEDGSVLRAVTADDVAYSINRLLDPTLKPNPSPVAGGFFGNIVGAADVLGGKATTASGIKVIDPATVEFDLVNADATFMNVLATPFASIVPKELAGGDATVFSAKPVGTGPYLFKSYTKGQGAVFVKNPGYWQAGQPYLDEIDYKTGQDDNAMLQQIEAGTLDLMGDPIPSAQFTDVTTNPAYADQIVHHTLVDTDYVFMDTQQPSNGPLSNVKVRQAVNYVIDKEAILQIAHGAGVAANCIYPPDLPAYTADCNPYPRDVNKAKQLMADAGFASGFSTKFYTDTTDPDPQIGASIQQDLASIGIKVDIVSQEFATFLDTIETPHKAPMGYVGWFQDYPDPSDFIDPILSCASAVKGGANAALYCNKAVDTLAATAKGETDSAKRITDYQQIQTMIMADAPWAPFRHQEWYTLVGKRVGGFAIHPVWQYDVRSLYVKAGS
ncbi:MAG: peptide/nickel transport system substrate-binding protein [Chloroflexota bacterium]|nr:peptide/nickel transport system substrate-binding protein [Chloroflexota bacterium]